MMEAGGVQMPTVGILRLKAEMSKWIGANLVERDTHNCNILESGHKWNPDAMKVLRN